MDYDFALMNANLSCRCLLKFVLYLFCSDLDCISCCVRCTRGCGVVVERSYDAVALDYLDVFNRKFQNGSCDLCHNRHRTHSVLIATDQNLDAGITIVTHNCFRAAERSILFSSDSAAFSAFPDGPVLFRRCLEIDRICTGTQAFFDAD